MDELKRLEPLGSASYGGETLDFIGDKARPLVLLKDVCDRIGVGDVYKTSERLAEGKMKVLVNTRNMTASPASSRCSKSVKDRAYRWYLTKRGVFEVLATSRTERAERWRDAVFTFFEKLESGELVVKPTEDPLEWAKRWVAAETERRRLAALEFENRAKVEFADRVQASDDSITVSDMAKLKSRKGKKIGRNRFYRELRERGDVLSQRSVKNTPSQRAIENGILELSETTTVDKNGKPRIRVSTRVTPKGQQYYLNCEIPVEPVYYPLFDNLEEC